MDVESKVLKMLKEDKLGQREIAKLCNISQSKVSRIKKKHGIASDRNILSSVKEIAEYLKGGYRQDEIALLCNCAQSTVSKVKTKEGVVVGEQDFINMRVEYRTALKMLARNVPIKHIKEVLDLDDYSFSTIHRMFLDPNILIKKTYKEEE